MSRPWGFLSLPCELRNIIYDYDTFVSDGYHYDYDSGKLRTSSQQPVYLALMRTCKLVAAEMQRLKLGSNVVNFSTISSETVRLKAAHFDLFYWQTRAVILDAFETLVEPRLHCYKTPDIDAKVVLRYPQFEPLLHLMHHTGGGKPLLETGSDSYHVSWGEARSQFCEFQDYMIELLARDTDYVETLANFYEGIYQFRESTHYDMQGLIKPMRPIPALRESIDINRATLCRSGLLVEPKPEPWAIPSDEEIVRMDTTLGPSERSSSFWERVKWRFSAAAAAIQFFRNASLNTRLEIRKIVLHENHLSVANPECHALGLIPFCLQNPELHIERRVSIWRNILPAIYRDQSVEKLRELFTYEDERRNARRYLRHRSAVEISDIVCKWITEASILPAKGMPANSFSLILDGNPALNSSSKSFEIVKKDAAWQVAQLQWYTDHGLSPDFAIKIIGGVYYSNVFSQIVNDIVEGKSFIRCNFPTGALYDPQRVLDRTRHFPPRNRSRYPGYEWIRQRRNPPMATPIRPLSPITSDLVALLLEDVMTDEELQAAKHLSSTRKAD